MYMQLPKKGLKIAHLNICSLRNKLVELTEILECNNIHILALTETHLDSSFSDEFVSIQGYNILRKDRNRHGGGVAIYIQNHIPVKIRNDLMPNSVEALWLQVHLPFVKPVLIGCCYRPPSANSAYLNELCEMIDNVCDSQNEIYLLGDFNISWMSKDCHLKRQLVNTTNACNLEQVVNVPTRIQINSTGKRTSSCIDLIFTNVKEMCTKGISIPVGCSDHNIVAINRKTKMPKGKPTVVYKRTYKNFCQRTYCNEVENISWADVYREDHPDLALDTFENLLHPIINKHAPIRKCTVRNKRSPWLDDEIRNLMKERDNAKMIATITGVKNDWEKYCKLRNRVTSINRKKRKTHFHQRIYENKSDGKKLWATINNVLGKKPNKTPAFVETENTFLTKPCEIANYFNDAFINKVNKLRSMVPTCTTNTANHIKEIVKNKTTSFEIKKMYAKQVEDQLNSLNINKPGGMDEVDGRLLFSETNLSHFQCKYR